jgi:hypothetical protein
VETSSFTALVASATERRALVSLDGRSGASLECLTIDGRPHVLKRVSWASDWIMRATGDTDFRSWQLWRSGLLDQLPACIDHAVVAMELEDGVLSSLMRDVAGELIPSGATALDAGVHYRFFDHLAALHARFWDWEADHPWLLGLAARYEAISPANLAADLALDDPPPVIRAIEAGWARLPERSPAMARIVARLRADARPLAAALAATPATMVHGDTNLGNLGTGADGRTILLDWGLVGRGPACLDLVHYLALNRDRLPFSKEAAMDAYRRALEGHGIDTSGWWDCQLGLSLLGVMCMFGWEKALGDDTELAWWEDRVCDAVQFLP